MTIDVFYSNNGSVGTALEKMYQKFLLEDSEMVPEIKNEKKMAKSMSKNLVPLSKTLKTPDNGLKSPTILSPTSPQSPQKKTSPNGLRNKKSPTIKTTARRNNSKKNDASPVALCENDANSPLRQKNNRSSNNVGSSTSSVNQKYNIRNSIVS